MGLTDKRKGCSDAKRKTRRNRPIANSLYRWQGGQLSIKKAEEHPYLQISVVGLLRRYRDDTEMLQIRSKKFDWQQTDDHGGIMICAGAKSSHLDDATTVKG